MVLTHAEVAEAVVAWLRQRGVEADGSELVFEIYQSGQKFRGDLRATIDDVELSLKEGPYR